MVIPVVDSIYKVEKISNENIKKVKYYGFLFVPLII